MGCEGSAAEVCGNLDVSVVCAGSGADEGVDQQMERDSEYPQGKNACLRQWKKTDGSPQFHIHWSASVRTLWNDCSGFKL